MSDGFVGTWRLVSFVSHDAKGREVRTYGPHPRGLLMYDNGGHMSVQIAPSDRSASGSDAAMHPGPETAADTVEGYFAYFGRYTVDVSTATVTHHVEASSSANLDGTDQPRRFRWEGDRLVLATLPDDRNDSGTTYVATWQRIHLDP